MSYNEEGIFGDCRKCPRHPKVSVGSPCGMFDGVCGECEYLIEMARHENDDTPFVPMIEPVNQPVVNEDDIPF